MIMTQHSLDRMKRKILRYHLGSALLLGAIGLLLGAGTPFLLGLVFGSTIGLLNFFELAKTLERAITMPPGKAQNYTTRKYFFRFLLTGIVLFVALKAPYLNALGTVLGLLLIKAVIYLTQLFNDKEYFKKIIKRKEEN